MSVYMTTVRGRWGHVCVGCLIVLGVLSIEAIGQPQALKYIETDKPEILTPIEGYRTAIGVRLLELVYRGLFTQDGSGNWVPELAAEAPVIGGDESEVIVRLRPDLRWPDGNRITARDVAFSFAVFMDPENNYPNKDILEVFERVEAMGEDKVKFVLRRAHSSVVARMSFAILPKHLHVETYLDATKQYSRQPMGAGPFEVAYVEDNIMRFGRNQHYHREFTSVDSIELVVNPTDALHASLLESDFVHLDPIVLPNSLAQLTANAMTDIRPYDSKTWAGFAYNCNRGILKLREVRQAMGHLFNQRDALSANFLGQGSLVSGPYSMSSFCRDPTIRPREHDPTLAAMLFEKVGVIDSDLNGARDWDGKPVKLRMVLSKAMSQANKNVCADFEQQLKAELFDVDVIYLEDKVWHRRVFYDHDYDITFLAWKFDDASNIYPLFSRSRQGPGQYNLVQYSNPQVEKLLTDFRTTVDDDRRGQLGRQLHAVLYEEAPYTFLWTLNYNAGYRVDRLKVLDIDPFYFFRRIDRWEMWD